VVHKGADRCSGCLHDQSATRRPVLARLSTRCGDARRRQRPGWCQPGPNQGQTCRWAGLCPSHSIHARQSAAERPPWPDAPQQSQRCFGRGGVKSANSRIPPRSVGPCAMGVATFTHWRSSQGALPAVAPSRSHGSRVRFPAGQSAPSLAISRFDRRRWQARHHQQATRPSGSSSMQQIAPAERSKSLTSACQYRAPPVQRPLPKRSHIAGVADKAVVLHGGKQ